MWQNLSSYTRYVCLGKKTKQKRKKDKDRELDDFFILFDRKKINKKGNIYMCVCDDINIVWWHKYS